MLNVQFSCPFVTCLFLGEGGVISGGSRISQRECITPEGCAKRLFGKKFAQNCVED